MRIEGGARMLFARGRCRATAIASEESRRRLQRDVCLVRDIICEPHHKGALHHRREALDL
jgi:hypothetical protein